VTIEGSRDVRGPQRCYDALKKLEGHTVYVTSNLRSLILATGALCWAADIWRGRAVTMELLGSKVKVTSLRRTLSALPDVATQYEALVEVIEWLEGQGVRAGSVSAMATALWRSTLRAEVEVSFNPRVGRSAFFGGRQASLGVHAYRDYVALDISKAYGSTMSGRPYAGLLREVNRSTRLDESTPGLATARVIVPDDLAYGPLPKRVAKDMIQFPRGLLNGTWSWSELAAASSLGCEVQVARCWAPATILEPFADWWLLCQRALAELSEAAQRLFKNLINALWGTFALDDVDSARVQWLDELGETVLRVPRPRRRLPQAASVHIAAETTSRVRVRMLLEGLYGDPLYEPAHVDTDGILVPRESVANRRLGTSPGEWRLKTEMSVLEVRAPQLYRYRCGESCGVDHLDWHYVASGVPGRFAHELFDTHPGFQISFSGLDSVLPEGDLDAEQLHRYDYAHRELLRVVYGPTLVTT